jgi:two-component system sensor histidine kinase BaeS
MPSSFRVRVFALIVLVSVVSVSATAWLTVRATTAGYEDSAAVASSTAQRINAALAAYGAYHGTWAGVPATVRALSLQTGQRIKLSTLDGAVIADSDTLANRIARPVSARPGTIIDPRP